MKHYYKINDPTEIKIVVLYTLYNADKHLTQNQLTHAITSSADIDYFDLYSAIDSLIKGKEMFEFTDSTGAFSYKLTEAGKIGAKHFSLRIPLLVREYISETLDEMFKEERKKKQLISEIIPAKGGGYCAHLGMCDGELPLMDLSVYAGTKEVAADVCDRFRKNFTKIYDGIIKSILADYDSKKANEISTETKVEAEGETEDNNETPVLENQIKF